MKILINPQCACARVIAVSLIVIVWFVSGRGDLLCLHLDSFKLKLMTYDSYHPMCLRCFKTLWFV